MQLVSYRSTGGGRVAGRECQRAPQRRERQPELNGGLANERSQPVHWRAEGCRAEPLRGGQVTLD